MELLMKSDIGHLVDITTSQICRYHTFITEFSTVLNLL